MCCERRHDTKIYHHLECIYYSSQVGSLCLHKNTFLSGESEPCIQAVLRKPRFGYGQITTIKLALQNKFSFYFFHIKSQENFPRTSIIFNIPLQTHGSLCKNHRFQVKHLSVFIVINRSQPFNHILSFQMK